MRLQIMEQIKQRIAVGAWVPGEEIPSIRALAINLRVSGGTANVLGST
jgi:GntR family transcriptional regulator